MIYCFTAPPSNYTRHLFEAQDYCEAEDKGRLLTVQYLYSETCP